MSQDNSEQESVDSDEYADEEYDPDAKKELDRLNAASVEMNRVQVLLSNARDRFQTMLTDSSQQLNARAKVLGSAIDKARPYYEALVESKEAQVQTQLAAVKFERACSNLAAAKETINLAEEGFMLKGQPLDSAWQEMLNHATFKVNQAEKEKSDTADEHQQTAARYSAIQNRLMKLYNEKKRSITKSRTYFEMKANFNQALEQQKQTVTKYELQYNMLRSIYNESLSRLETISNAIHERRREARLRREFGERSEGVGAEEPPPPPDSKDTQESPAEASRQVYVSPTSLAQVYVKSLQPPSTQPKTVVVKQSGPLSSESSKVAPTVAVESHLRKSITDKPAASSRSKGKHSGRHHHHAHKMNRRRSDELLLLRPLKESQIVEQQLRASMRSNERQHALKPSVEQAMFPSLSAESVLHSRHSAPVESTSDRQASNKASGGGASSLLRTDGFGALASANSPRFVAKLRSLTVHSPSLEPPKLSTGDTKLDSSLPDLTCPDLEATGFHTCASAANLQAGIAGVTDASSELTDEQIQSLRHDTMEYEREYIEMARRSQLYEELEDPDDIIEKLQLSGSVKRPTRRRSRYKSDSSSLEPSESAAPRVTDRQLSGPDQTEV